MAQEEIYEESGRQFQPWCANGKSLRMGEIVLIIDADTIVPEDCFRDAAREMFESPDVAIIQHESGKSFLTVTSLSMGHSSDLVVFSFLKMSCKSRTITLKMGLPTLRAVSTNVYRSAVRMARLRRSWGIMPFCAGLRFKTPLFWILLMGKRGNGRRRTSRRISILRLGFCWKDTIFVGLHIRTVASRRVCRLRLLMNLRGGKNMLMVGFFFLDLQHYTLLIELIPKDAMRLFSTLLSSGGDMDQLVPNSEASYGPKLPCIIKLEWCLVRVLLFLSFRFAYP